VLPAAKRFAFLVDATTLRAIDFTEASAAAAAGNVAGGLGTALATISHDTRIDWLVRQDRAEALGKTKASPQPQRTYCLPLWSICMT
jgi:hypothetical protein